LFEPAIKDRFNRGKQAALHFWRDSKGLEVDLLLDDGSKLTPVEIKSGQTITADSQIAWGSCRTPLNTLRLFDKLTAQGERDAA